MDGPAQLVQPVRQLLQVQAHAAGPRVAQVLPVLGHIRAALADHGHAGDGGDGHILQQPQLHAAGGQDGLGGTLVEVVIQQRGTLIEQLRAPVVEGLGLIALGGEGKDGLSVMPDGLEQSMEVDAVQKLLDRKSVV